jgi:hypothetical protein
MVIFVYLIITFTVLLNATPDIEDLIFYYECYLIIFLRSAAVPHYENDLSRLRSHSSTNRPFPLNRRAVDSPSRYFAQK